MRVTSADGSAPAALSRGATVAWHPWSAASSASCAANARQVPRFEPCSTASVVPALTADPGVLVGRESGAASGPGRSARSSAVRRRRSR